MTASPPAPNGAGTAAAPWQTVFQVVPHRAIAKAPRLPDARTVSSTEWWRSSPDSATTLRATLGALVGPMASSGNGVERWTAGGSSVELHSAGGVLTQVIARVDVRKLDPRFGAALLGFLRSAQSVLVRSDGRVVEPTVGAFSAALRSDPAWAFANDPAVEIAAELREDDG